MERGGGFSGGIAIVPYSPAIRARSLADEFKLEKRILSKQDEVFAKSRRWDICRFSLSDDDDGDVPSHLRTHEPALKRSISLSFPAPDNSVDPRRRSRRNGDVVKEEDEIWAQSPPHLAESKVYHEKPARPGFTAHPVKSPGETWGGSTFSALEAKAEQIKKFFSGSFWKTSNEDKQQPEVISGPTRPRPALRRTFSFRARSGELSEIFEKSTFDKSTTFGKSATFPGPKAFSCLSHKASLED